MSAIKTNLDILFSCDAISIETHEEYDSAAEKYSIVFSSVPPKLKLQDFFSSIILNPQDSISVNLTIGDSDPIQISNTRLDQEYNSFSEELSSELTLSAENDISATVGIEISKQINTGLISVYHPSVFTQKLNSQSASGLFYIFSSYLSQVRSVCFISEEFVDAVQSTTMAFCRPLRQNNISFPAFDRNKRIQQIRSVCHFVQPSQLPLIPEDFLFDNVEYLQNYGFLESIKKLLNLTLILCLYDITEVRENNLKYRLDGYKVISEDNVNINNLDFSSVDEYQHIYEWLYGSNNLIDKIGITRNILSLHIGKNNGLSLPEHTFLSVKSSFKIYEKENVKQYIEVRNKISEQILDFNNRASGIVDDFAGGFQKSIIAVLTFFSSVLVIQVISNKSFEHIFNSDTYILALLFIGASLIYYFISRKDIKIQKQRFISSYNNLKSRYTDLLIDEDINAILNNDSEFNEDVQYIDTKLSLYSRLWLWTLGITFATITGLYCQDYIKETICLIVQKFFL